MASTSSQAIPAVSRPRAAGDPGDPAFSDHPGAWARSARRFPQQPRPLSNADLALHTGLSRPTVSRLAYTLAELGYLKRDAKGRYPTRPRHIGRGLSGADSPESPAIGAATDARLRRLCRRHCLHRDAVRPRFHLCPKPCAPPTRFAARSRLSVSPGHWRRRRSAARCCRCRPRMSCSTMCRP